MKFASLLIGAALAASLGVTGARAADLAAGKNRVRQGHAAPSPRPGRDNFHGPALDGPIDRTLGAAPGHTRSEALEKLGIFWIYDTSSRYPRQPEPEVPGVEMTFPGPRNQADIDDVIAYVCQFRRDGGQD